MPVRSRVIVPLITDSGVGTVASISSLEFASISTLEEILNEVLVWDVSGFEVRRLEEILKNIIDLGNSIRRLAVLEHLSEMLELILEIGSEIDYVLCPVLFPVFSDLPQPILQAGLVSRAEDGEDVEVVAAQVLEFRGIDRGDTVNLTEVVSGQPSTERSLRVKPISRPALASSGETEFTLPNSESGMPSSRAERGGSEAAVTADAYRAIDTFIMVVRRRRSFR